MACMSPAKAGEYLFYTGVDLAVAGLLMNVHDTKGPIAVALSGGIDSTAAAAVLKEEGREVFGIHLVMPTPDAAAHLDRAEDAARRLGIPFYTLDAEGIFTDKIIGYFVGEYLRGRTPNPCILCNQQIKLGLLADRAVSLGAEKVATGHYARVAYDQARGRYLLYKGLDPAKEQSYFLATLSQEQLARLVLPLGTMCKEEVKRYVAERGCGGFSEPESQEVCFVPGDDYRRFVRERLPSGLSLAGEIVDSDGNIRGEHDGVFNFTIGQRRGLRLPDATPFYVVGFEPERRRVVIGKKEHLDRDACAVENITWISVDRIMESVEVRTRIRYKHREASSTLVPMGETKVLIRFHRPQRAITPGQAAVFYEGETVLGSGFIV